jgi:hypothetical protein
VFSFQSNQPKLVFEPFFLLLNLELHNIFSIHDMQFARQSDAQTSTCVNVKNLRDKVEQTINDKAKEIERKLKTETDSDPKLFEHNGSSALCPPSCGNTTPLSFDKQDTWSDDNSNDIAAPGEAGIHIVSNKPSEFDKMEEERRKSENDGKLAHPADDNKPLSESTTDVFKTARLLAKCERHVGSENPGPECGSTQMALSSMPLKEFDTEQIDPVIQRELGASLRTPSGAEEALLQNPPVVPIIDNTVSAQNQDASYWMPEDCVGEACGSS